MNAKKILFVAMHDSPHAARWIDNISDCGFDLHLFPLNQYPVSPLFRNITIHRPMKNELSHASIYPFSTSQKFEFFLNKYWLQTDEFGKKTPKLYGSSSLARLIKKLKPDLIHSMEFQHCSYKVLDAKKYCKNYFPPWLATNWGSDIYYYHHFLDHRNKIIQLLKNIDFYSCECQRDIVLARNLGMTAKVLPVLPNSGGFDIIQAQKLRSKIPTSKRRLIMIKGYQHFAGRVLTALKALEQCVDCLERFEVVIFSAGVEAIQRAKELRELSNIKNIHILEYSTHDKMLEMHSQARVYLGVSISDAISTSVLEAMAMGAFPIQTDTSCCEEWFKNGEGGYIVPSDNVEKIAGCLRSALTNDELVDTASIINWETVTKRLDQDDLKQKIWDFYDQIFDKPFVL